MKTVSAYYCSCMECGDSLSSKPFVLQVWEEFGSDWVCQNKSGISILERWRQSELWWTKACQCLISEIQFSKRSCLFCLWINEAIRLYERFLCTVDTGDQWTYKLSKYRELLVCQPQPEIENLYHNYSQYLETILEEKAKK